MKATDLASDDSHDERWEQWLEMFRKLQRLWNQRGFIQMFRSLLDQAQLPQRVLQRSDGQRRMTNLLHLMELLHEAAGEHHLGPEELIQWLAQQREATAHGSHSQDVAQIRLESDDHAVTITTIHRSKGLEYPLVFCPYLWDGNLLFRHETKAPLFHRDGRAVLQLRPNGTPAQI